MNKIDHTQQDLPIKNGQAGYGRLWIQLLFCGKFV